MWTAAGAVFSSYLHRVAVVLWNSSFPTVILGPLTSTPSSVQSGNGTPPICIVTIPWESLLYPYFSLTSPVPSTCSSTRVWTPSKVQLPHVGATGVQILVPCTDTLVGPHMEFCVQVLGPWYQRNGAPEQLWRWLWGWSIPLLEERLRELGHFNLEETERESYQCL